MNGLWELAALFLAGLSLFLSGVSGVRAKLQQLSGRRFRRLLSRATDRPLLAGMIGVGFGAVTQSASAAAFILSGMVATGMIGVQRALPVVAASNLGTAALVFLAAMDMRLAILALLGITGLLIHFRVAPRHDAIFGALFAVALLFFGIDMMKQAFAPLPNSPFFLELATFFQAWLWAPFLLGAALRMIVQSSSAIGVIAIALQQAGLFSEIQAIMLICGTGPGVALAGVFLSGNLSGPPRQIVLYQGLINLISGSALGLAFYLSEKFEVPFLFQLIDLVDFAAGESSDQLAWTFFMNMSGCLIVGLTLLPFSDRLLQRLAPPTLEQDLSRPAYLHDEAQEAPETAVDLVDKEQQRLFSLALGMLETIREESEQSPGESRIFHGASVALNQEIRAFINELIKGNLSREVAAGILSLERRQENLGTLLETLHHYTEEPGKTAFDDLGKALMDRLTEALHLILLTAKDAWELNDPEELGYLLTLTEDRGDLMERIRRSYQDSEAGGAMEQRSAIFYATTLFERAVWILRQIGLSLKNRN